MRNVVYSLWLKPGDNVYRELKQIIFDLSKYTGSPPFDPHVTLAWTRIPHDDEAIQRARLVATAIKPVTIRLGQLINGETYYKSLYLRIESTKILTDAFTTSRKLFCVDSKNEYDPHLSLLYGCLSPLVKASAITQIRLRSDIGFRASTLYLLETEGSVRNWRYIEKFTLF